MLLHKWRESQNFWLLSYSVQLSLQVHYISDAKKNILLKYILFYYVSGVIVIYCSEYIIFLYCLYYFIVLNAKIKLLILSIL